MDGQEKEGAVPARIMREIGSKGGKIGGKRSLETMTPEQRSARAKKASDAAAEKRTAKRLLSDATAKQTKEPTKKSHGR